MIVVRGLAELTALALNAFVVILATRAVGPALYGTFAVTATLGQIGIIAVNAGLQTLGSQRIANLGAEPDHLPGEIGRIWSTIVATRLILALLVVGVALGATAAWVADESLRGFIFAILPALLFVPFKSEWLLVATGDVHLVALTRVLGAIGTASLALAFIHDVSDASFLPLIFVAPIVISAIAGFVIVFARRHVQPGNLIWPRRIEVTEFIRAGVNYLKAEASVFVYANSDRLFLYAFAGAATVGLYDAAYKLIQPFYAISSVVGDSMYRSLAQSLGTPGFRLVFRRWVDLMLVATMPVGFLCLAFAPLVIEAVYGPAFGGAAEFLALLGWVITFGYMAGVVTIPFTAWNAPAPYGSAVLAGSLVNLALNIALIPWLGGTGAALATIAAKVTVGGRGIVYFRRLTPYPVATDFGFYFLASGLSVLLGVGAGMVVHVSFVVQLLAAGVCYASLVGIRFWRSRSVSLRIVVA